MKKKMEVDLITDAFIVKSFNEEGKLTAERSFHWSQHNDEILKMIEHLLLVLGEKDNYAIITKKEWAKRRRTINV